MRSRNHRGIYLTIYSNILEKRKSGFVFLLCVIAFLALSIRSVEKGVEDILSPYYRYAYAPVTFNKDPKDLPLLWAGKPTKDAVNDWPKITHLSKGEDLYLIVYFHNNSFLYKAVNTKLRLRKDDAHHFTAILQADNATAIQQKIEIRHNCNNPNFPYVKSDIYWTMLMHEPVPLTSEQTGPETLISTSRDINIGEVLGSWGGIGNVVTKFKYECLDTKRNKISPEFLFK